MTPEQRKVDQYLQHYGEQFKTSISLKNGLCALYDGQGNAMAVVEVPEESKQIVLQCPLLILETLDDKWPFHEILQQLLMLNFETAAMRGCWLAMDQGFQLRLCYMLPIETTDQGTFTNTLTGFIDQVIEVRLFVEELITEADRRLRLQ